MNDKDNTPNHVSKFNSPLKIAQAFADGALSETETIQLLGTWPYVETDGPHRDDLWTPPEGTWFDVVTALHRDYITDHMYDAALAIHSQRKQRDCP